MISFQFTCPSRSTTTDYLVTPDYPIVSIHVPLAEHDKSVTASWTTARTFQFTCPSRSTTGVDEVLVSLCAVSIHVPLAEHDQFYGIHIVNFMSFNSRAPRGARRGRQGRVSAKRRFQFTCPSRSTTTVCPASLRTYSVSIHVPLAEHDPAPRCLDGSSSVSIHVPLAEHDPRILRERREHRVSIHVPLAEHDQRQCLK